MMDGLESRDTGCDDESGPAIAVIFVPLSIKQDNTCIALY